jgi:hypothetical protein
MQAIDVRVTGGTLFQSKDRSTKKCFMSVNEGTRGLALFLGLLALLFTVAANSLIGTCQEKTLFDWSIQIRRHPNTEHSSPGVYPHHDL